MAKLEIRIGSISISLSTEKKSKNPLQPGEFYYNLSGAKWGGHDVSKPKSLLNGKNGDTAAKTSHEFLATELEWRGRLANNNPPDRALAIEEINTAKAAVEGKKRKKIF